MLMCMCIYVCVYMHACVCVHVHMSVCVAFISFLQMVLKMKSYLEDLLTIFFPVSVTLCCCEVLVYVCLVFEFRVVNIYFCTARLAVCLYGGLVGLVVWGLFDSGGHSICLDSGGHGVYLTVGDMGFV